MRREVATGVVWFLSCSPIALPTFDPSFGLALGSASVLALAALPWLAWSGLPSRSSGTPIATAAFAAPPLAAALALDVGRGTPALAAIRVALASLAMILLLGFAARRASFGRLRAHDVAWLVLVPGLPALRCALELGGAPAYGDAPRWLALAANASPIAWAFRSTSTPWPAVAVCAGLLLLSSVADVRQPSDVSDVRARTSP